MTAKQLAQIQDSLARANTALGVAGEAMTLEKKLDAQRALIEAGEELKRCKELLATIHTEG